jgi:hypothetical protein
VTAQLSCFVVSEQVPVAVLRGFEIFDPFFSELRYPQRAPNVAGLGECHGELLLQVCEQLEPLLDQIPPPS